MPTQVMVNFGFADTNGIGLKTSAGASIVGFLLQSVDYGAPASCEVTIDGQGNDVNHTWFNPHEEATLECVFVDSTATPTISQALTNTTLAQIKPGTLIQVTPFTALPDMPSSTVLWEVQSTPRITGSNVNAKKVSIPIKRFAGIQKANA